MTMRLVYRKTMRGTLAPELWSDDMPVNNKTLGTGNEIGDAVHVVRIRDDDARKPLNELMKLYPPPPIVDRDNPPS